MENNWKAVKFKDTSQMVVGKAGSFDEHWWECAEGKEEPENASSLQAAGDILLVLDR